MNVNPLRFANAMADRISERGISASHKKAFQIMAKTFNDKISGTTTGLDVLPLPTGVGKTIGLSQYAFMTKASMLIAVRRIDDAKEIVANINALAEGKVIARDVHSENRLNLSVVNETRIIVITHAAYKKLVNAKTSYHAGLDRYRGESRKLHVIDESIDIFDCAEITLSAIKAAEAALSETAKEIYVDAAKRLKAIIRTLENSESGILRPSDWQVDAVSIAPLIQYGFKNVRLDQDILERNDIELNDDLISRYAKTLMLTDGLPLGVCNISRGNTSIKISAAKVALPLRSLNAVILDATASQNIHYKLMGKGIAKIIKIPSGIRNYSNLTLYTSQEHKLGRTHLSGIASEQIPMLMKELPLKLRKANQLLICTHSNIEAQFQGYEGLPPYEVAHYGAIDGRNDWKDYDAMLIFGIPYIPQRALEAQVAALEEYHGRTFSDAGNIASLLQRSIIKTSIIQAMNRIRCRTVIDNKGNCAPAFIRLFLPNETLAARIMKAIKGEMPDIRIVDTLSGLVSRKVKRSGHDSVLFAFLSSVPIGSKYTRKEIGSTLNIKKASLDRLISRVKDVNTELGAKLAEIGIILRGSIKGGRGHQLIFEKTAVA